MSTSATSSISSMLNSKTRISGFSSGLDVDSLVSKLMDIETAKVDKVKQQKQYLEWQKSAYREFTTALTALKNKYFNVTSSSNLFSSSAFNKTAVAVSDSSIVKVTGSSTAGESTHSITVNNIATVGAKAGISVGAETSKTMAAFTGKIAGDTVLTIGSTNYSFNAGETVSTFMSRVNNDPANSTYNISYDSSENRFVLATKSTGENTIAASGTFLTSAGFSSSVTASGETPVYGASIVSRTMASFTGKTTADTVLTIGSKDYKFNENETVSAFMSRVNNDPANSTYRISYDSSGTRFVLTTKSTGVNTVEASGTFLTSAGFASGTVTASGENASFTIDGIPGYTSTTNTFTSDGLTYNFLKEGTANVSSTRDVDGIVKNVQEFVTAYNAIIDSVNTKTSEKKYRDYTPLTDEQKEAMEESDIKLWEEKAKSGILRSDSLLTGLGDKLKEAMYQQYTLSDGTKMSLSEIGISTTSYSDMGKLTVNETKLRKALTETPDKVTELMTMESQTAYSPDGNDTDRKSGNGVFANISDIMNDYIRTTRDSKGNKGFLLEKAGTTGDTTDTDNFMSDLITDKEDLITDLLEKLSDKEDYYYSKFTAMETAISNMNSQASFLTSLNGSGS